jgi:hypothetical protein
MKDEPDLEIEELYNEFLGDMVGFELRKKPSPKEKKEILREAMEMEIADHDNYRKRIFFR